VRADPDLMKLLAKIRQLTLENDSFSTYVQQGGQPSG